MLASMDEGHRAFIFSNRTLRNEVLRIFDSTAITYSLESSPSSSRCSASPAPC
jgi:hypothetical protein